MCRYELQIWFLVEIMHITDLSVADPGFDLRGAWTLSTGVGGGWGGGLENQVKVL